MVRRKKGLACKISQVVFVGCSLPGVSSERIEEDFMDPKQQKQLARSSHFIPRWFCRVLLNWTY